MPRILLALIGLHSTLTFALQGQLRSQTEYFPDNLGPPTEMLVPRLGIELQEEKKLTKTFRYSFKGTFDTNLASKQQPEEYFGDLQEAYVELRASAFKFRTGWNTVNWGVLDGFSPMDVVNQRIFFDPLNPTKRGAPMVEMQWNPAGWSFSALYIPWQARAMLPSGDSRWYPRDQLRNISSSSGTLNLPPQPLYDVAEPIQVNKALENNFGFNLEKQWDWLDLHAMYFNGSATMPGVTFDGTLLISQDLNNNIALAANPIYVHPLYYRTQTSGLGFSATTGEVIVRGEAAYTDTVSDARLYGFSAWSWQYGIGLEKNWEILSHTVTQILHYYRGVFPADGSNLPSSGFRMFDDTLLTGFRFALADDRYFYGSILYDIPLEGLVWMIGYQMKLTDSIRWDISWRNISSSQPGLLQSYNKNDHAAMELVYFF